MPRLLPGLGRRRRWGFGRAHAGFRLRAAEPADAKKLGWMHAEACAETYRGLLPVALVAEMADPFACAEAWARRLAAPPLPGGTLLAERPEGLVGFISVGAAREKELNAEGEVTGLYLLRRAQRQGIGRALLAAGAARLLAAGHRSAAAWALDANLGARAFYAATGAAPGTSQLGWHGDHQVQETAWVWQDLARLRPDGG